MSSKKNIVFVTSYPKSGATWFQFLIYSCYKGSYRSSREVLRFYPPANRIKLIEQSKQDPVFIKSHAAFSHQLPHLVADSRVILLVRHPLDVILSLINHHINQGSLRLLLPYFKRRYIKNFIKENKANNKKSWCYHLNTWLKQETYPLQVIRYEDLISDPVNTLMGLRNAYKLDFDDQAIRAAVDYCSIQNMKDLELKEFENKTAGLFYSQRRSLTKKIFKSSFVNKGGSSDRAANFSEAQLREAVDLLAMYKSLAIV